MLHILSKRIASFVCDKNDNISFDIYVYGFELLLSSIIETVLLLTIGFIIGRGIETILFIVSFSSIRIFSGGYHANSYIKCFMVTLISYIFILLLTDVISNLPPSIIILIAIIIFVLSLILFLVFCPVKSNGKTIFEPKKQKKLSIISLSTNMILSILFFAIFKYDSFIIIFSTIPVVDVMIIIEKYRYGGDYNEKELQASIEKNV